MKTPLIIAAASILILITVSHRAEPKDAALVAEFRELTAIPSQERSAEQKQRILDLWRSTESLRSELPQLQREILAEIPKEWIISQSRSDIILTLRGARFLNSISQPLLPEDKLWQEYAWTADYIIHICITPGLSAEEYASLVNTREALRKSQVSRKHPYTGKDESSVNYFVDSTVPLPLCRIREESVWISSNDRLGHHWVRPGEAEALKQKLIKLLLSQGEAYQPALHERAEASDAPREEDALESDNSVQDTSAD